MSELADLGVTRHLKKIAIDWDINESGGGYAATVNGKKLYLHGGDELTNITLTIIGDSYRYAITQPRPHISKAPAGRAVKYVAESLGLPKPFENLSQEAKDDIELSENLEFILKRARDKFKLRLSDPQAYAEYQEIKKQKLFRELLEGRP